MEALTGEVLDIHSYRSYREYKAVLDGELQRSAESFVRIGYLLKVAMDTDILKESGYRNVNEFAQEEYNLDKSQVSRFIRINDEFSENGYSDQLQEKYKNFGYAKLALMLLLPSEINEELTAGYSKADIRSIKEEIEEEKKTSDLEIMMEEKDEGQQSFDGLVKVLYQIGRDDSEMYLKLYDAVCSTVYDETIQPVVDKLMDALAPSGVAIITVRIAGEGRKMLSIKGADIDPVVVDVRSGEKMHCTWDRMINGIKALCPDAEDGKKAWEILYGESFPEKKGEVAPVQPQKRAEVRRQSKVTKAKMSENTRVESGQAATDKAAPGVECQEAGKKEKEQEAAGVEDKKAEREAQGEDGTAHSPDQQYTADAESDHDENGAGGRCGEDSIGSSENGEAAREEAAGIEPDTPEKTRTEAEYTAAAGKEKNSESIADQEGLKKYVHNQQNIMFDLIKEMERMCAEECWDELVEKAKNVITRVKAVKDIKEVYRNE